jgi:hypothetical protein
VVGVAAALGAFCIRPVFGQEQKGGESAKTNSVLNDYEDWQQWPIRNAELQKLMDEAELIVAVQFDLKKLMTTSPETNMWVAKIASPVWREGIGIEKFKGNCGKQIIIQGDLKAFDNPAPQYISKGSFREMNDFLVFLKAVDTNGVYQCLASNPGGFRIYGGRTGDDHRRLLAGRVNGALIVESVRGYHGSRMCGPTNMRDALEGIQTGLKLTATAKGGATVELRFENPGRRPISIPKDIKLFAPLLWAEVDGAELDQVLLSQDDYVIPKFASPYKEMQNIAPSNAVTVTVELPTGPVPKGGTLRWALNNHAKPLAGSLPAGQHEVRILFRPGADTIAMSNPVKVEGKAGGAGPAQLATLERPPCFVPYVDPKPEKPLPPLKDELKGQIWFDSNREGNWEIYVMDANGSNAVNVTKTPDMDESCVAVSPDGKRLAYCAGKKGVGHVGLYSGSQQIWVADKDGQNAKKIADNARNPAWWIDSKSVIYGLSMQNTETGAITQLLTNVKSWLNFGPTMFAPATRKLVGGGGLNTTLCGMIMVVELDENAEFKDFAALTTTYRGCTQRWLSPEGRRVIVAHHDPKAGGGINLWSMNPDGTDPRRFARSTQGWPGEGTDGGESPDGTMYVAAAWGNIYVGRYADGAQLQLTNKQGSNGAPVWRKGTDGK